MFHIQLWLTQAMKLCCAVLVSDKAVLEKGAKDWKHRAPVRRLVHGSYLIKYFYDGLFLITADTLALMWHTQVKPCSLHHTDKTMSTLLC